MGSTPARNLDKISILIVDDEVFIRKIIRQVVQRLGIHNIWEGADGDEAYDLAVRYRPNVILCDIHMKPTDGMSFLARLRLEEQVDVRRTPVVFLTSNAKEKTVLAARELDVDGYIIKPVVPKQIALHLEKCLGVHLNH